MIRPLWLVSDSDQAYDLVSDAKIKATAGLLAAPRERLDAQTLHHFYPAIAVL